MGVSTMKMSNDVVRSFAHYICNLNGGRRSGISTISSINETGDSTTPVGDYPAHWVSSRVEMISMEFDHSAESRCSRPR